MKKFGIGLIFPEKLMYELNLIKDYENLKNTE